MEIPVKKKITMVLGLLTAFIASCQGSQNTVAPEAQMKTIFVKGDPISFVEGTTMNKRSFLTEVNINTINNFRLSGAYNFVEREDEKSDEPQNIEDLKQKNKANEKDASREPSANFILTPVKGPSGTKSFVYGGGKLPFSLIFTSSTQVPETYELTKIRLPNEDRPVTVLHYSVKPDFSAFSFLVYDSTVNGKSLVHLVFSKNSTASKSVEVGDTKYRYMAGPGVKLGWNQSEKQTLNLCGSDSLRFKDELMEALNQWAPVLKDRLTVNFKLAPSCPPFSDINFRGVYFVKNYLTYASKTVFNPMSTILVPDFSTGHVLDSDIIILRGEYEKVLDVDEVKWDDPIIDTSKIFYRTVMHEFGHFLGLDHQFDGTESIMSYDKKQTRISTYDEEAIALLYPLKPKK